MPNNKYDKMSMRFMIDFETRRRLEKGAVLYGVTVHKLVRLLIHEYVPTVEFDANGTTTTRSPCRPIAEAVEAAKQRKPLPGQTSFLD